MIPGARRSSPLEEDAATAFATAGPPEWQHVAALATTDLWLSAEETRQVTAALAAVLEPYRDRAAGDRPEGTRRVRALTMVSRTPGTDRAQAGAGALCD